MPIATTKIKLTPTGRTVSPVYGKEKVPEYTSPFGATEFDGEERRLVAEEGWLLEDVPGGGIGVYKQVAWMDAGGNVVAESEGGRMQQHPSKIRHGSCELVGRGLVGVVADRPTKGSAR